MVLELLICCIWKLETVSDRASAFLLLEAADLQLKRKLASLPAECPPGNRIGPKTSFRGFSKKHLRSCNYLCYFYFYLHWPCFLINLRSCCVTAPTHPVFAVPRPLPFPPPPPLLLLLFPPLSPSPLPLHDSINPGLSLAPSDSAPPPPLSSDRSRVLELECSKRVCLN